MDWITGRFMLPPQGSAFAGEVDTVFLGIYWLSQAFFWGITIAAIYFAWRFRYKAGRVTPHITHNTTLEVVWTALPLLMCVGIFFWGLNGYMKYTVAPGDAMEVLVTGKQWLWQFEYPDGSRTVRDLHVQVGKPVKLTMTSEDVLHDFYIPDMRVKHDVVPGRYTQIWFTPTVLGEHTATCAEYCGKDHSGMKAVVSVDTPEQFANFLLTGGTEWEDYFPPKATAHTPADWGKIQYERKGCNSCHTIDGSKSKGPSWKGIFGKSEAMTSGPAVVIDEAYLRDSMMNPGNHVVQGFDNIMPTFQGLLKPNEIQGLVAFIESLK